MSRPLQLVKFKQGTVKFTAHWALFLANSDTDKDAGLIFHITSDTNLANVASSTQKYMLRKALYLFDSNNSNVQDRIDIGTCTYIQLDDATKKVDDGTNYGNVALNNCQSFASKVIQELEKSSGGTVHGTGNSCCTVM
ncbi:hypothetical protein FQN57_000533 [Myotisia sp. PD_48]|nr:hypothetical protein FQN57_000533 [Myotisia sp. PD_48]